MKRLHLGVLLSTTEDSSQCMVLDGIAEFANVNGINLTAYIGTYQTIDYEYISHYDMCFDAIRNNTSLDGLICLSGFIAPNIGTDSIVKELALICDKIPTVSVSISIPGIPSILTDNLNGIFYTVDHLIKVHKKTKIAFVMGPAGHPEAEERLSGYKKALADNNIEFDERYVLPGNFTQDGGNDAVIELIDKRGLTFDAIATSDDGSAMGVLRELKKRNIAVPASVLVTGFDDDIRSETFIPSITTVRQDFFRIGMESAEALMKKLYGAPVDEVTYVTPVFLARQSCGCSIHGYSPVEQMSEEIPVYANSLYSFIDEKFSAIFKDIIPPHELFLWGSTLARKLTEIPFNSDDYLTLFDEMLISYNHYSENYSKWHEVVSFITEGVEYYIKDDNHLRVILSTLVRTATLIYDVRLKNEKNIAYTLDDFRIDLRRVANSIVSMFDISSLREVLRKTMPILSLDFIMVGLFCNNIVSGNTGSNRNIDIVIGYEGDRELCVDGNDCTPILYSDYSLIDGFDFNSERRTLIFFPLFFESEEIGILILPYNAKVHIDVYEYLRSNISTAIKGAGLISRIRTLSITDELTGLLNRRGFFQFSYARLKYMRRSTDIIPTVMFMDMDGLKHINDTYGHKEGDTAIHVLAKILKETLREEDIIGRMGGDEFIVLSLIKSPNDGEALIKRIRDNLDEYNSKKLHPYIVSASIGCIVLEDMSNECFEAAVLSADSVMYEEKKIKRSMGLSRN